MYWRRCLQSIMSGQGRPRAVVSVRCLAKKTEAISSIGTLVGSLALLHELNDFEVAVGILRLACCLRLRLVAVGGCGL